MLAANTYSRDYIEACRARMAAQVAVYNGLRAAAGGGAAEGALQALEAAYFGNLLLALDAHFVHRLRGAEGKDGNPLNEVRMLCASMLENDNVLRADKTIRYVPARSVLGLEIGQPIRLDAQGFTRLAEAFLAEIERRYGG